MKQFPNLATLIFSLVVKVYAPEGWFKRSARKRGLT